MDRIDGKIAFITGGARGIGLGIARAFARTGVKLALVDIDQAALAAAKAELAKTTAVETFILDVRDRVAYARVADETESLDSARCRFSATMPASREHRTSRA